MTPGTLDLKVVSDRLAIARRCLDDLRRIPVVDLAAFAQDFRNAASAESLLRRAIEAVLDTARHVLTRVYGLPTLEYREVAREAGAKGLVADPLLAARFVEIAGFRNRLTHFYDEVTPQELYGILTTEIDDLGRIAERLAEAAARLARRDA